MIKYCQHLLRIFVVSICFVCVLFFLVLLLLFVFVFILYFFFFLSLFWLWCSNYTFAAYIWQWQFNGEMNIQRQERKKNFFYSSKLCEREENRPRIQFRTRYSLFDFMLIPLYCELNCFVERIKRMIQCLQVLSARRLYCTDRYVIC